MLPPPPTSTLFPYTTLFRSLFALVRDAIAVSIRKSPNARRSGDVNGPLVPEAALREHHLIGEHLEIYRSEEHTSELQSLRHLVCRLLLEKKKKNSLRKHTHV